jgi:hypothetical protein
VVTSEVSPELADADADVLVNARVSSGAGQRVTGVNVQVERRIGYPRDGFGEDSEPFRGVVATRKGNLETIGHWEGRDGVQMRNTVSYYVRPILKDAGSGHEVGCPVGQDDHRVGAEKRSAEGGMER